MKELGKRTVTSIFYVVGWTTLILLSRFTTMLACAVVSGICAYELYRMLRSDANIPHELIGIVTSAAYPFTYYLWHFNGVLTLTVTAATVLLVWYVIYPPARFTDVALTLFGACYTGLLLSSLIGIREILHGLWGGLLVFGIILSVWANDAFAYLFGSRFGRHKLAPRISPNKSYEGLIAGLVGSVAAWCLLVLIPGLELQLPLAITGGLLTGVMGILGDLVESRIKRATGFKDSGKLLPGHGGFLDRQDSLLLVAGVSSLFFRMIGLI
jgi:phosphatidate cytidylyltransferase